VYPDIAQNNDWNEEAPSRFNSNVDTTGLVEHDDSYRDPSEDQCCCTRCKRESELTCNTNILYGSCEHFENPEINIETT
jgi:hypothetical protein